MHEALYRRLIELARLQSVTRYADVTLRSDLTWLIRRIELKSGECSVKFQPLNISKGILYSLQL